jgi:hypothetical protein
LQPTADGNLALRRLQGPAEQSMIVQGELAADGSQMAQLILGPNDPLQLVLVGQTKGKSWVYSQGSVSRTQPHGTPFTAAAAAAVATHIGLFHFFVERLLPCPSTCVGCDCACCVPSTTHMAITLWVCVRAGVVHG